MFDPSARAIQTSHSEAAGRFLDWVEARPDWLRHETFGDLFSSLATVISNVPGIPPEEGFGLQPWPLLISPQRRAEQVEAVVGLGRLVRSVPQRFFDCDPRAVAEFYGLDAMSADLFLAEPNDLASAPCRGDFVETAAGLQCLELNFGSLGGWQETVFAEPYLSSSIHAPWVRDLGVELSYTSSLETLFEYLLDEVAAARRLAADEVNVLILVADEGINSVLAHAPERYRAEYAKVRRRRGEVGGHVEVVGVSEVEFRRGEVWARGRRFQAVVEQSDSVTSAALFRSFKAGRVVLMGGFSGLILGDKRNLALLSEAQETDRLDDRERRLVRRFVPWTRWVRPGPVEHDGRSRELRDLLLEERSRMVLKAAQSLGGGDVHVGLFETAESWRRRVDEALEDGAWIAQEFVESLPWILQQGERGWAPYAVVWGLFAFGERFGGTYLRMAPQGTDPVLNVARGARVGLAFVAEG
ncbi:MAG: hypothetical protein AAF604_11800 [Acidobacteriota bacterium]